MDPNNRDGINAILQENPNLQGNINKLLNQNDPLETNKLNALGQQLVELNNQGAIAQNGFSKAISHLQESIQNNRLGLYSQMGASGLGADSGGLSAIKQNALTQQENQSWSSLQQNIAYQESSNKQNKDALLGQINEIIGSTT